MLTAMLHGKSRRLPDGVVGGQSLPSVFAKSEDLLTATVFERLVYLSGQRLWSVLRHTFSDLPAHELVELERVEFWPNWGAAFEELKKTVEPDVVLHFTVGQTGARCVLVVESKLGAAQYAEQWAQEWIALKAELASERGGIGDEPIDAWLLALGGIDTKSPWPTFLRDQAVERGAADIRACAAGWPDLLRALVTQSDAGNEARIIKDCIEALQLFGFRDFNSVKELPSIVGSSRFTEAARTLLSPFSRQNA